MTPREREIRDFVKCMKPVLRRAKAVHKDFCKDCCYEWRHHPECIAERIELKKAHDALAKITEMEKEK